MAPLHHYLEGFDWARNFAARTATIRAPRERLLKGRQRRFRRLVGFLRDRSPYYADLIRARRIDPERCRVEDFPVLTKSDLIEHFDRIITDRRITRARLEAFLARSYDPTELLDDEFFVVHTSGTSGTVGYYVYSRKEWLRGASHIIRFKHLGFRTRLAYVGATGGHFVGVSLALTGERLLNWLVCNARTFDVNRPLAPILEGLNRFQPQVLSGYAATLRLLAEQQAQGDLNIAPRQVVSSGEPLLGRDRELLERTFGVPVTNVYACSEHLFLGVGQPGEDMYLLEDDLIFECEDDHTLVTNLFNRTMPLVRFKMDDVLLPSSKRSSDHPFTLVRDIVGRREEPLVFRNRLDQEDFIHPIVMVEFYVPHLAGFQVGLVNSTSFVFRARMEEGLTAEGRAETRARIDEKLRQILAEKEMQNVSFRIDEVDSLPVDSKTGKFRLVVRESAERVHRYDRAADLPILPAVRPGLTLPAAGGSQSPA